MTWESYSPSTNGSKLQMKICSNFIQNEIGRKLFCNKTISYLSLSRIRYYLTLISCQRCAITWRTEFLFGSFCHREIFICINYTHFHWEWNAINFWLEHRNERMRGNWNRLKCTIAHWTAIINVYADCHSIFFPLPVIHCECFYNYILLY